MQTATAKAWLPNQPRYALPDLHAPAKPQEGRAVRPGNGTFPRTVRPRDFMLSCPHGKMQEF
jgi:hypothetical protein